MSLIQQLRMIVRDAGMSPPLRRARPWCRSVLSRPISEIMCQLRELLTGSPVVPRSVPFARPMSMDAALMRVRGACERRGAFASGFDTKSTDAAIELSGLLPGGREVRAHHPPPAGAERDLRSTSASCSRRPAVVRPPMIAVSRARVGHEDFA